MSTGAGAVFERTRRRPRGAKKPRDLIIRHHTHGLKSFTTPGDKAFKFTVTGKNASSTGYSLSTDYIGLTPQ